MKEKESERERERKRVSNQIVLSEEAKINYTLVQWIVISVVVVVTIWFALISALYM
jgi:hypothetical protein